MRLEELSKMEIRPKIRIELRTSDKIVELLCLLSLLIIWFLIFFNYPTLPDSIPTHYNGTGQVDNHGNKITIFTLPIICIILYVGLTILNKYPHIFNYPTSISLKNAKKQYTLATRMIRYLKFAISLIFSAIVYKTIQTAEGRSNGLGGWFLPITLALIFIPLTIVIIQTYKAKNN